MFKTSLQINQDAHIPPNGPKRLLIKLFVQLHNMKVLNGNLGA